MTAPESPGRVPLPPGWEALQESYYQAWDALFETVSREVFDQYPRVPPECPWSTEGLRPELRTRQIICYWGIDRTDPMTGSTVLRRWVDEKINDSRLREALLWSEHPRPIEAIVREQRTDGTVMVQDAADGRQFIVRSSPEHLRLSPPGSRVSTHLQPWGTDWRFIGVSQIRPPVGLASEAGLLDVQDVGALFARYRRREASRIDDVLVRPGTPLPTLLARYPAEWVDRITEAVRAPSERKKRDRVRSVASVLEGPELAGVVGRLTPSARELLREVLAQGGVVPRSRAGHIPPLPEGEAFWELPHPRVPAEVLRLHGLLFYGRVAHSGGRLVRSAIVPATLRRPLDELVSLRTRKGEPYVG